MRLLVENIGKLASANIEMNGITLVAGENNTGKSTIGKVLYCIVNSLCNIDKQVKNERISIISNAISSAYHVVTNRLTRRFDVNVIAEYILDKYGRSDVGEEDLKADIINMMITADSNLPKYTDSKEFDNLAKRIQYVFKISESDVKRVILNNKILAEFGEQVNNLYNLSNLGLVELNIGDDVVRVTVVENEVKSIENTPNIDDEAIYIDDMLSAESAYYAPITRRGLLTHREILSQKLFGKSSDEEDSDVKNAFDELIASKSLVEILDKINTVCGGTLVKTRSQNIGYQEKESGIVFNMRNLSSGIKAFSVIKTLLLNGVITDGGIVILDEPEVHLHPSWQLVFAELIVLMQKQLDLRMLISTHSPYFLDAIETYSVKHGIGNKCKYYLADCIDGKNSFITDVSNNIELIYKKLARPLQELENERYTDNATR